MTGQAFINSGMYSVGKFQTLATDTNLRAYILDVLNLTLKDISSRCKSWTWLEKTATFPTVVDQLSYDLPTDIDLSGRKVIDLRQTTSPTRLIYRDQKIFDDMYPDPTTNSGNPLEYTIFLNTIRLYPVPSAVITMTMRYLKMYADLLTDGATTTDIPPKFDNVVLDGVKVPLFKMFPSWGDSNSQKIMYEQGIVNMLEDNNAEIDNDNISLRHGGGVEAGDLNRYHRYDGSTEWTHM